MRSAVAGADEDQVGGAAELDVAHFGLVFKSHSEV
jgi:hypothetical protein